MCTILQEPRFMAGATEMRRVAPLPQFGGERFASLRRGVQGSFPSPSSSGMLNPKWSMSRGCNGEGKC